MNRKDSYGKNHMFSLFLIQKNSFLQVKEYKRYYFQSNHLCEQISLAMIQMIESGTLKTRHHSPSQDMKIL